MFCSHCGKEIPDGAVFCSYCGKTLASTGNFEESQKNKPENKKGQKNHGAIIAIAAVLLCACVGLIFFVMNKNKSLLNEMPSPIVYCQGDLYALTGKNESSALIADFTGELPDNYNDSDSVVFSNDGRYLYYFDYSEGVYNADAAPLYRAEVDSAGHISGSVLIDQNVLRNTVDLDAFETVGNGLIYMACDNERRLYQLKYYDGNTSSVLVEDAAIDIAFSKDRKTANICAVEYVINEDWEDWGDMSWYRMTITDHPEVEYICKGIRDGGKPYFDGSIDFQTMADNDIILNISSQAPDSPYCDLEVYRGGVYDRCLTDKLLRGTRPFGINIDEGKVSYYIVSTADGEPDHGVNDEGYIYPIEKEWSLFYSEDGELSEVNEEYRNKMKYFDLFKSEMIYAVNDELVFENWAGVMAIKKNGDNFEVSVVIDKDSNNSTYGRVVEIKDGKKMLVYWSGVDLYLYSDGVTKKIGEELNGDYEDIYTAPNGDQIVISSSRNGVIKTINLSKSSIDSFEADLVEIDSVLKYRISDKTSEHRDEYLRLALPYDETRFLCIMTNGNFLICNDKKAEQIPTPTNGAMGAWSVYRRVHQKELNAYVM